MFSNLSEKVLRYFAWAKKLTGSVSAACGQLTLNLTTSSYCCNYTDILGATSELQYCIFFKISHNPPNQGLNYFLWRFNYIVTLTNISHCKSMYKLGRKCHTQNLTIRIHIRPIIVIDKLLICLIRDHIQKFKEKIQ